MRWLIVALIVLAASAAVAETRECPRTEGTCALVFVAPSSPGVTHVCTEPVFDARCVAVEPGAQGEIPRQIVTGAGDQTVALYAYRQDLDRFSAMSADQALLIDLGRPSLVEVLAMARALQSEALAMIEQAQRLVGEP